MVLGLWAEPEERNGVEVGMRLPVAELAQEVGQPARLQPPKGRDNLCPVFPMTLIPSPPLPYLGERDAGIRLGPVWGA